MELKLTSLNSVNAWDKSPCDRRSRFKTQGFCCTSQGTLHLAYSTSFDASYATCQILHLVYTVGLISPNSRCSNETGLNVTTVSGNGHESWTR